MRLSLVLGLVAALGVATLAPTATAQTKPSGPDWFEGDYEFVFATFTDLSVAGDVDLRRLTLEDRRYDADELRDAYRALRAAAGPQAADAFVASVEAALADSFRANLESAFPDADVAPPRAELDAATLEVPSGGDPNDPPVAFALATDATLDLATFGFEGAEADDVLAVLDAGAQIDVPASAFADPGHMNAFTLRFPEGTRAISADGAAVDGNEVRFSLDNRYSTEPASDPRLVRVASDAPPLAAETTGRIEIVVDIKDLDVSIADAAGGDFGEMLIDVTGTAELDVVAIPESVRGQLPAGVHMDAITAEGLRTLVELGFVEQEHLDAAGRAMVDAVGERFAEALDAPPTGLQGGLDVGTGDAPLLFRVQASVAKPLSGAPDRGAAIALYSITQSLPFERIEGLDTTYRVVLPEGIAVTAASSEGAEVSTRTREDGRDEAVLTLAGDDAPDRATMQVQLAVTPTFVMNKFWPVLVGALALVGAVVGLAIWSVRRKKK